MCGARQRVSQRSARAERDSSKQALRSIPDRARIRTGRPSCPMAGIGRLARQHRSDRHSSFEGRRMVPKLRRTHSDWAEAISPCRHRLSRIRPALAGVGCAPVRRTKLGVGRFAYYVEQGRFATPSIVIDAWDWNSLILVNANSRRFQSSQVWNVAYAQPSPTASVNTDMTTAATAILSEVCQLFLHFATQVATGPADSKMAVPQSALIVRPMISAHPYVMAGLEPAIGPPTDQGACGERRPANFVRKLLLPSHIY